MPKVEKEQAAEEVVARKPAPDVHIVRRDVDDRSATANKFDSESPEFVHSWDYPVVEPGSLERSGKEVVKVEGKEVRHGGDILYRQPKELFERKVQVEQEDAESTAKTLAGDNWHKFRKARSPVVPKLKGMED